MVNIKSKEYDFGANSSTSEIDLMNSRKRHSMGGPEEMYGASYGLKSDSKMLLREEFTPDSVANRNLSTNILDKRSSIALLRE